MKKLLILVDGSQTPAGDHQWGTRAEEHGSSRSHSRRGRKNWGHDTPSLTAFVDSSSQSVLAGRRAGMTTLFGAILVSQDAIEIVTDLA